MNWDPRQSHPKPCPLLTLPGDREKGTPDPDITCSSELVCQLLPHSLGEVEVVVILIDALQEQRDMLEDNGVLAPLLLCDAQLLVQPVVLGLLQCRALRGIVEELGIEHQKQDAPYPEAEVVISPRLAELLHSLGCGDVAQVVVATDQHQWNVLVNSL